MSIKIVRSSEYLETPVSHNPAFLKRVILKNGDVPNLLQLASAEFNTGDVVAEHVHESMCEIFCILEGSLKLEAADSKASLSAGDVFSISPGTKHKLSFTCKTKLLYFGLNT